MASKKTAQPSELQSEAASFAPLPGREARTARGRLRFSDGGVRNRAIHTEAAEAVSLSIAGHQEDKEEEEEEEEEEEADWEDNVEFDFPLASGSDLLDLDLGMSEGLVGTSDTLDSLEPVPSIPEPSPPVLAQRTAPDLLLRQASETEEYKPPRKSKRGPETEQTPLPVAQLQEADGDGRRKKHKAVPPSDTAGGKYLGKFACPYFKRNPKKYRKWTSCPGPGWDEVHRVKYVVGWSQYVARFMADTIPERIFIDDTLYSINVPAVGACSRSTPSFKPTSNKTRPAWCSGT